MDILISSLLWFSFFLSFFFFFLIGQIFLSPTSFLSTYELVWVICVSKLFKKWAEMQRACQCPSSEKNYIRNMNVFVSKKKSDHIASAVSRDFDMTASHTAASRFLRPPPTFVWSGYKRLGLTTVACSHRVALNGAIDVVELSKMLKTLKLPQHFTPLSFTLCFSQTQMQQNVQWEHIDASI